MLPRFLPFLLAVTLRAQQPENVNALLEPIRAKHHLPGLAAAAMRGGKLVAVGATGVRVCGHPEAVSIDDRWHLGSCTKSMTSSLAAMLVEDGKLKWDARIGDVLTDLRGEIGESWKGVTLEQLLMHRAGAPHDAPPDLWAAAAAQRGSEVEQRLAFVRGLVSRPTESPAGSAYSYSNQGYAIAGAMLERASGMPFDQLIAKRLFAPLGMHSAGFGTPGTAAKFDQPRGHRGSESVEPDPGGDNPPAITPAGRVHCSIADFARYAAWHARGESGDKLLGADSFKKLHTPVAGGDYAMGWVVTQRDWASGTALTHNGTNTMWFAVMWLSPAKDAAFVAATNIAGDDGAKGTDEAVAALIGKFQR